MIKYTYIFSLVYQENTGFPYLVLVTVTSPQRLASFYQYMLARVIWDKDKYLRTITDGRF